MSASTKPHQPGDDPRKDYCLFELGCDGWAFIPLPCSETLLSTLYTAGSRSFPEGLIAVYPAIPLMLLLLAFCFLFPVLSSMYILFHRFSCFLHFWSLLFLLSIFNPFTVSFSIITYCYYFWENFSLFFSQPSQLLYYFTNKREASHRNLNLERCLCYLNLSFIHEEMN